MVSGGKAQDPKELDKVRAGPPLAVMKRRRSWGDSELLGSNTEDTTDNSEQDEASSLRSSWSLVSHGDRSLSQSQVELEGTHTCFVGVVARPIW